MLKIIEGSLVNLKTEMKVWKRAKEQELRFIKKKYKSEGMTHFPETEKAVAIYSYTKNIPVKIEGIIINYKLYEAFIKKLKKIPFTEKLVEDTLVIEYKTGPTSTGKLVLYDMSSRYSAFNHIPTAALEGDSQ